jgi:hypothetical protein
VDKTFLLQEVTQFALDGIEEVLSWPRHGYKTTKRKGMVWNKLIAAQSILENAPRLKLDNEMKYDNKRLNDSENWNLAFYILWFLRNRKLFLAFKMDSLLGLILLSFATFGRSSGE